MVKKLVSVCLAGEQQSYPRNPMGYEVFPPVILASISTGRTPPSRASGITIFPTGVMKNKNKK
jgi:hypothetical protein